MTNKRQLPADLFETIKKALNVGLYGDIPYDFPYSISVNQYYQYSVCVLLLECTLIKTRL